MMMGNHRTLCTFRMPQIGRWVIAPSKADSNLHSHCLAISRKQCSLWILFLSQHLNSIRTLKSSRISAHAVHQLGHRPGYCLRRQPPSGGGAVRGQKKVCVRKMGLKFSAPLISFIFGLRKIFLIWVRCIYAGVTRVFISLVIGGRGQAQSADARVCWKMVAAF